MIIFKKKFGVGDFLSQLLNYIGKFILNFNRKNRNKFKFSDQIVGFTDELITDTINFEGLYEKRELLTLISWLKPSLSKFYKSTMIDVGANIGNHTLFFSNYFSKVIALEPHERIFKVLKLNTEQKDNIKILKFAASDRNHFSFLKSKMYNLSGSNLINKKNKLAQKVICKKIDNIINKTEKVSLIKIDVEGHEYKVLKGASKTIKKNKPLVLFEHHLNNFKSNISPTINLLKKMGYKKFAIISPNPRVSHFDSFLTRIYKKICQLMLNNMSFTVTLQNNIKPDYYPFIIAIPNKYNI